MLGEICIGVQRGCNLLNTAVSQLNRNTIHVLPPIEVGINQKLLRVSANEQIEIRKIVRVADSRREDLATQNERQQSRNAA